MKMKKILSMLLAAMMLMSALTVGMTVSAASITYSDVTEDMWSYEDIVYVTENSLMNGTGGTTFSPAMSLTRSMVVTVLWRMEGSPRVTFRDAFLDVKDRLFYSDAVIWAKGNGIVTATTVTDWGEEYFSPDRDITRQELATMFIRYADYKEIITSTDKTLDKFSDKADVASWAESAMKWATSVGLINGTGNGSTLSPTGKATREQFAAIMHRFATIEFDYNLVYTQPKPISKYTAPAYPLVEDADLYVAVDGNDSNPGTFDKPLATFDAARLKVRELKATAKDEIVVAFKAGNYGVLDNVTFTAEDAGTAEVPIKYCKYGDGDVIFRNGVYIEENEFTLVEGEEALKFPEIARPYIFKADLSGRVEKFTNGTRLYSSTGVVDEAREPNGRYYSNVTTTVDPYASIQLQKYLPGIVEKFSSYENVKVNGFLRTGWFIDCFPILSYDKETCILTFDFENAGFENGYSLDHFELMYEGRTDDLIFFSNLPEFLDIANEYYFDNKTSTLYVYRAKGDYAIDGGKEFITVDQGADHLSFVGFEFNTTSGNGLIVKANYFTMDLCKVGNIGGHAAINADISPVHHFTVKNSEFFNFVDTGIFLLSAADAHKHKLESANNVIVNNYFHDFTLPMYFSSAIEITRDVGGYIAHNEFYQGSHGGIRYNDCIDLVIEYNVFDEMMTRTQDFGAVYTWRSAAFRDNHIRYNMFNNCHFIAIYLDNNTMGQHVYGNIFYNSADITQNGGCRGNYIHDNIQIKSGGVSCGWGAYNYIVNGNPEDVVNDSMYTEIVENLPKPGTAGYDAWYARWPDMFNINTDPSKMGDSDCIFTIMTYLENNVRIDNDGKFTIPEMTEMFGEAKNNVGYKLDVNPFFANPGAGDYTIVKGSDNFTNPYDFAKIGRY